jgi:hypothetical protein
MSITKSFRAFVTVLVAVVLAGQGGELNQFMR